MDNIRFVLLSFCLILFVFGIILALVGKEFIELTNVIYNLKEKVTSLEIQMHSKK